jgi:flavin-binding protein dodecin
MSDRTGRDDAILSAFLDGQTFVAIANEFGLSVTRVTVIIDRAVKRAAESVDPVPRSVWEEVRDWRRAILAYVAEQRATGRATR